MLRFFAAARFASTLPYEGQYPSTLISAVRLYRIPVLPDHFRQAGDSRLVSPERSLEHQFLRGKPENDPAGIFRRRGFLPTVIARQISVLSGR